MKKLFILCSCFLVLTACGSKEKKEETVKETLEKAKETVKEETKKGEDLAKDILTGAEYYTIVVNDLAMAMATTTEVMSDGTNSISENDANAKIDAAIKGIQKIIDTKAPTTFPNKKEFDDSLKEMITLLKNAKEEIKKAYAANKDLSEVFSNGGVIK